MNEHNKSKIVSSILRKVKEHVHEYLDYGEGPAHKRFADFFSKRCVAACPMRLLETTSIRASTESTMRWLTLKLSQRKNVDKFDLRIVIEPSYEDATSLDYIYQPTPPDGENSVRAFVIHTASMKP